MNEQTRLAAPAPSVPFTAEDYLRMLELGAFEDMRVELVRGEIERMMPSGWSHGELFVTLGALLLDRLKSAGARVGGDVLVRIDDKTVRAADIVVLRPGAEPAKMLDGAEILLAVEIAETTLARDMADKRIDYAAAGIPHYWVADLARQVVHVFGKPIDGDYAQVSTVGFEEPLALPIGQGSITIA